MVLATQVCPRWNKRRYGAVNADGDGCGRDGVWGRFEKPRVWDDVCTDYARPGSGPRLPIANDSHSDVMKALSSTECIKKIKRTRCTRWTKCPYESTT